MTEKRFLRHVLKRDSKLTKMHLKANRPSYTENTEVPLVTFHKANHSVIHRETNHNHQLRTIHDATVSQINCLDLFFTL